MKFGNGEVTIFKSIRGKLHFSAFCKAALGFNERDLLIALFKKCFDWTGLLSWVEHCRISPFPFNVFLIDHYKHYLGRCELLPTPPFKTHLLGPPLLKCSSIKLPGKDLVFLARLFVRIVVMGACLTICLYFSQQSQPPHLTAKKTVSERLDDFLKVSELVRVRSGDRRPQSFDSQGFFASSLVN